MDYTDAMVLQQLIYGLADEQIQRKLLAKPEMTLGEAEKLIIAEESRKWSQVDSKSDQQMAAGMSSYKSQQVQQQQVQKQKTCNRYGRKAHSKEEPCPASEVQCRIYDRVCHYARVCKSKKDNKSNKEENNAMMEVEDVFELTISSLGDTVEGDPTQEGLSRGGSSSLPLSGRPSKGRNNVLPHMVFNKKFGKFVDKKGVQLR